MAMLAEPRRKRKFGLNPRGTLWSNDDEKLGKKMMEKMGWSKGKGLGKFEQGEKEHLSIRFKDDTKGIAYKGSDQWVKHYEGFESALAALNSENNSAATSPVTSNANSTVNSDDEDSNHTSLEALSKKSQARVHYSKFTRGKDLSRLSSDDVACITGSKGAKILTGILKKEEEMEKQYDERKSFDTDPTKTINRGSMKDYFAMKMLAFKNRTSQNESKVMEVLDDTGDEPLSSVDTLYTSEPEKETGKKKRKDHSKDFDDYHELIADDMASEVHNNHEKENIEENEIVITNNDLSPENHYSLGKKSKKKKKKEKKCHSNDADREHTLITEENLLPEVQKPHDKESKEKKKKRKLEDESKNSEEEYKLIAEDNQSPQEMQNYEKESSGKKKKKKGHKKEPADDLKLVTEANLIPEVQYSCETEHKKKKKEKKRNNDNDYRQDLENSSLVNCDVEVKPKKHKKKKNSD